MNLWAALCLVAVLEGLLLFAVPGAWKQAMGELQRWPEGRLRRVGALLVAVGLASLWWVRG